MSTQRNYRKQTFSGNVVKTEETIPQNVIELPLRVTDPEKIHDRIQSLPVEVREVIDEKFRGEYFAIERIDRNKLI